MYTFYFQALEDYEKYKLVATKGRIFPTALGLGCKLFLEDIVDLSLDGYRIVIQPVPSDGKTLDELGDKLFPADMGFEQTELLRIAHGHKAAPKPLTQQDSEYLKFVNYANGQERDWCGEDYGVQTIDASAAEVAQERIIADNANSIAEAPGIGPLPPQAPLAPTRAVSKAWSNGYKPWEPSDGMKYVDEPIPPEGTMLYSTITAAEVTVPEEADKPVFPKAYGEWFDKVSIPEKPTSGERSAAADDARDLVSGEKVIITKRDYQRFVAFAGGEKPPKLSVWESIKECFRWS